MARLARVEVFAADEIAIVHVTNRVVRCCFLLGDDSVTGKNFDHRKRWLDEGMMRGELVNPASETRGTRGAVVWRPLNYRADQARLDRV